MNRDWVDLSLVSEWISNGHLNKQTKAALVDAINKRLIECK